VAELAPREAGHVRIYCCGPTVYDVPHAGHARAFIGPDVLVRHLRAKQQRVTYVRNITDVDDKILERAKQNGEPPLELSRRTAEVFQTEMRALGCLDPDHEPRVSDHLPQIIVFIEKLVARGSAYVVDMGDGKRDVYFSVRSFNGYGKLSRRRIDDLLVGARVEKEERKQDPLDFALWKGANVEEWGWDSPWGHGRPGWHIECSAMSEHYLGHGFDIHAGGMDLIFPHHENEIAQSEAALPEAGPFSQLWMHNGFVNVDKEKMSKSLGNFVTVRDVLERNDPEAFRWFLLTVHYRGPIQFETEQLEGGRVIFPGVDEAERRTDYLYQTLARLKELVGSSATAPAKLPPELVHLRDASEDAAQRLEQALDDDLNTPVALAALGEILGAANELCDAALKRKKDVAFLGSAAVAARIVQLALERSTRRLGLGQAPLELYAARTRERRIRLRGVSIAAVDAKLSERTRARAEKDFTRSDAIREELAAMGISLRDGPEGTEWTIAP
jgi:cysteinyl-tRNA synthetase